MNRRDFLHTVGGLAAFSPLPLRLHPSPPERLVERWSWAMGQSVHLVLFHHSEEQGYEVAARVLAELRRIEARLSLFDDASDLAELNRHAGQGAMRVDADLRRVLRAAARFRAESGGAFDVAVEPLMRVWGFRQPRTSPPGASELREARAAVQAAAVEIEGDRVTLPAAHTELDLGGIAVGYALDQAALLLKASGVRAALLDISGDCILLGAPPGATGWRVDIVDPRTPGGVLTSLRLRDSAVATSANSVSVVRYGALVRGHVMDPATGYPADRLRQTSVVARSGLAADALSTAALVAGRGFVGVERLIEC